MSLIQTIDTQIVEAMRAKDSARLLALRNLKAACMSEAITLKKTDALSDDEALTVIRRLVKQRKDSALQFRKGGREEMAVSEEAEMKILESYLPAQMPEADVRKIAKATKEKLGVADKTKLGQLIGAVLKETKGKADGGMVKKVVESLFE
ncbi:MAG: aspartyl-tRNA amidotransferase [Candidatus Taylorbacteria bacterium CG11_big_fil_rev_8_21_14_0_20_46_11]|uniref:Aspartyl-tRNA amidotransferase n=1 Tax=Candidatus Taylorbacteria bacterium CG11_big_fil_rev_8_21_14_0_20_46_11 TaxID=1975025 RepID=A0A2H0KB22_9BACT|nr:MAG: aspartyl-tRNA amidotransferase [Candidatus Taylorbacteria bacterium CG11_big_fil_rev_8_21_14_0_20_46_11]